MTVRAFLSLAVVVVLTGTAVADTKVGVLGLEVAGAIDVQATTVARNLTNAIRTEANKTAGFIVPASANKELLDEKVNASCDTEAPDCMAAIGKRLGVQKLIFGRITTKGQGAADGYALTLKMLDVEKKSLKREESTITLKEASDGVEGKKAVDVYRKLAGLPPLATTPETNGNPDIVGPVGPPTKKKPSRPGGGWRIATYASGTVAIALAGGFIVSAVKVSGLEKDAQESMLLKGHCDPIPMAAEGNDAAKKICSDGKNWSRNSYITGIGAIGVGLFAVIAGYKGFFGNKESSEPTGVVGRKRKSSFALTPVVSPGSAGATVRFDW